MTPSYVLTPRAQSDIEDIWDFTVERWGVAQAERYVRQLQPTLEGVAARPRQGRACDDIRPGYFKIGSGSHLVFYRLTSDGIEIVRILHQSMDIDSHL
ncbi:MAG TPA: type II toxin-antitoxin system RelE/ParE family toxin [Phenylobacterium sp.]|mgnify:CR=1 FL=1|nr:type II toxin-antitoxin system RelE/ParE family toxin [Phenylobacterium sp.]HQP20528.1 type II toxin-antitoxin system RelE/ParE family toxin [Phenylobacterium sp.]